MKFFLMNAVCIILFVCISCSSYSQYYLESYPSASENPGNLNHDNEEAFGSGLPADWTLINSGFASSPSWSSNQSLPFTFNFNNQPVSSYKVSTSGVLTFDVASSLLPGDSAVMLPDVTIPAQSLCVLGLVGSGTVMTKVFGNSPNRQQWIMFCSFAIVGCYSFWSIVLEEGTDKIYFVDQKSGGCFPPFSLGIQVDSSSAMQVPLSPAVLSLSTGDPTSADNSYYAFVPGIQPQTSVRLISLAIDDKFISPSIIAVKGIIKNLGSDSLHRLDITYQVNGNSYTDQQLNLQVAPGDTFSFTHSVPYNASQAVSYPFKVWIDAIGDLHHADDTLQKTVQALSYFPVKHVLLEQVSGTWCGWCPLGYFYCSDLQQQHPNTASVISVHNNDPMQDSAYNANMFTTVTYVPHGNIDRVYKDLNADLYENNYQKRIVIPAEAEVDFTLQLDTVLRQLTIPVTTTFAGTMIRGFRLAVILSEDSVHGLSPGYAQSNYFSYQANSIPFTGIGHDWLTEPNPVPAATMYYNQTARTILGGYRGQPNSVPDTVVDGNAYSYTFTTILPAAWNIANLHAVAILQDTVTGEVINSMSKPLNVLTAIASQPQPANSFSLYPDPAESYCMIQSAFHDSFRVLLTDITGRIIFESPLIAEQGYRLSLTGYAAGLYLVNLESAGKRITKPLLVR